jgi:hypothetical protein
VEVIWIQPNQRAAQTETSSRAARTAPAPWPFRAAIRQQKLTEQRRWGRGRPIKFIRADQSFWAASRRLLPVHDHPPIIRAAVRRTVHVVNSSYVQARFVEKCLSISEDRCVRWGGDDSVQLLVYGDLHQASADTGQLHTKREQFVTAMLATSL